MQSIKLIKSIIIGSAIVGFAAHAGESNFGWVYGLDLQPKGKWELEQRLQLTRGHATGTYDYWQGRSEVEYGLTDNIQLAGYLNTYSIKSAKNYTNPDACSESLSSCTGGYGVSGAFVEDPSYSSKGIEGVSLEAIWRITNPLTSPVGIGVYFEPTFGRLKDAIETRLIVQSNFLDDRLQLVGNLVFEAEKLKFDEEPIEEIVLDFVGGLSYRVAPNWSLGFEYRFHNDYDGFSFASQTQRAHFIGPNIHYANKDFWVTMAMRTQIGGDCWAPGDAECSDGMVWDSHGRNEYMLKVGVPF